MPPAEYHVFSAAHTSWSVLSKNEVWTYHDTVCTEKKDKTHIGTNYNVPEKE
jgi:hypothetical protein